MLLLNKTLLRMAKGLWGRIALITFLKLVTLVGTAEFAQIISGFLGNIASPALSASNAGSAVLTAFITAAAIFLAELLKGEAEYRCTAKARQSLRAGIFSKVLELDVGSVEKIGPVLAILLCRFYRIRRQYAFGGGNIMENVHMAFFPISVITAGERFWMWAAAPGRSRYARP